VVFCFFVIGWFTAGSPGAGYCRVSGFGRSDGRLGSGGRGAGFGPAVLFDIVIGRKRNVVGLVLAGLAHREVC
jgi:hypothetical protein